MLKFLRLKQVQELVPWSRSTIYRKEKAGEFPKSISLGPNSRAWISEQIEDWMKQRTMCPKKDAR